MIFVNGELFANSEVKLLFVPLDRILDTWRKFTNTAYWKNTESTL